MRPVPETPVRLVGGDLRLRSWIDADLPELAAAFADAEISRWNPGPDSAEDEASVREWIDRRNDWSGGDHASWAISDVTGAVLGSVSLHHVDLAQENSEVGHWTAPWAADGA